VGLVALMGGFLAMVVAGVIQYYGWREVTALYTDDDFGNNGIDALGDALKAVGSSIVNKAGLDPKITSEGLGRVLATLSQMESRVFVVHLEPTVGRELFVMAQWLQMVSPGYVWVVTEAMSSVMDYLQRDPDLLHALQYVVATRSFVPPSPALDAYRARWAAFHPALGPAQMNNVYALHAYDAVWMIAHAIQTFLSQNGTPAFVDPAPFPPDAGGRNQLANLKLFRDGALFMRNLLAFRFTGVAGPVQVDARGDFVGSSFDIMNMVGNALRVVGFWSNSTGCLPSAPNASSTPLGISHALGHSSKSGVRLSLPILAPSMNRQFQCPIHESGAVCAVAARYLARWSGGSAAGVGGAQERAAVGDRRAEQDRVQGICLLECGLGGSDFVSWVLH
jgi:ionotropic glutamate receptor